ncbi:hypothetical protein KY290_017977 [Solanum tuberosum]|uniref:Retrotransposon gag domain-containing protein n=1 Tax=Solanum tuberosum TaxID=4113 RepID=A0ABQ7VEA0_SOLTU|nr:hypothetical protein KY284_016944 [Solanum tuberosum]KAH0702668.1 hypothetical protein KY285_016946 [Solanum tuberosum]KAH0761904.1 hypothetical protein KY290_017977 [Solanum tuberosum]
MGDQDNPTPTSTRTQSLLPTANAPPIQLINSAHPFFISHSDSPGTLLVNTIFDGKRGMWIALTAKNKSGFIDGSTKEPEAGTDLHRAWSRSNNMVISWLLNYLSLEISESVIYYSTDIWAELEDRFGQSSGPRLFQLQKELSDLVQGSSNIAGYYTKIKRLWNELDTLDTFSFCPCDCTCGANEKNIKAKQGEHLVQFLMGLNDSYYAPKGHKEDLMRQEVFSLMQVLQRTSQSSVQRNAVTSNDVFGDSFTSDTVSTDQAKLLTAE